MLDESCCQFSSANHFRTDVGCGVQLEVRVIASSVRLSVCSVLVMRRRTAALVL